MKLALVLLAALACVRALDMPLLGSKHEDSQKQVRVWSMYCLFDRYAWQ